MLRKIVLFLCIFCSFCIINTVQAETPNYQWGAEAVEVILNIGNNIDDNVYTSEQFKYLKYTLIEYIRPISNIEKKREFSQNIINKVAIGLAEKDIAYLNEALMFLQITMNNYGEVYYFVK